MWFSNANSLILNVFIYLVFDKIEDLVQALIAKKVDGMLIDHYTASYYQSRHKLKSLITVKKFEFHRDFGILISKDAQDIVDCVGGIKYSKKWHLQRIFITTYRVIFLNDCSS